MKDMIPIGKELDSTDSSVAVNDYVNRDVCDFEKLLNKVGFYAPEDHVAFALR